MPRNCGPVDPVERPAMYRKGEGRRQGGREAFSLYLAAVLYDDDEDDEEDGQECPEEVKE